MVTTHALSVEDAVRSRYTHAATSAEVGLCCPASSNPGLLAAVPHEILERDYGCGDPTRHVSEGATVLDLGSGAGKACYMLSQVVGRNGRVIGVDMNDEMLALARRHLASFNRKLGFSNLEFHKARIQDLRLDLSAMDTYLRDHPVRSSDDLARAEAHAAALRAEQPLIANESVDVVVSDCVLNLVRGEDKGRLFGELHRVLRRGGRAVISDIVSDEDVPAHLQADPDLWTGCVSGAMREDRFLEAFERAGFYGISIVDRQAKPWRTVEGIEFRSLTVIAHRGKEGPCWDRKQAVIYRGPFKEVRDDDGHVLRRGARVAVCDKTFRIYARAPYREHFDFVEPRVEVPLEQAPPFPCGATMLLRDPRDTKGADVQDSTAAPALCSGGSCKC
ncbi:MAG: methyltransferase domain-containing protein [Deltaproteobacteria bacterium]|nr:methyltransferase domain-containing protein [Deltaproteobacteria bacterium]